MSLAERRRRSTRPSWPGCLSAQLVELTLAPVVRLELLDDALPEDPQGCDQGVELVQRVDASCLRVELELEHDPIVAVGQLENHPRLEVERAPRALGVVAPVVPLEAALTRVLHVG